MIARDNTRYVFLLAAVAALASLSLPARAARDYDGCTGFIDSLPATLTTPGTWCARKDLNTNLALGDAIRVITNHVVLDCNEFKIGNLAAGPTTQAYGVWSLDAGGITVRNCNIRGFHTGVLLDGGSNNTVEDNRFDGNYSLAVGVGGGGSVIRRNLILRTGGSLVTNDNILAQGIDSWGNVDILDNVIDGLRAANNEERNAVGMFLRNNGGVVARNRIGGMDITGEFGQMTGIALSRSIRPLLIDNVIYGDGSQYSTGISCFDGLNHARARGNTLIGFKTPLEACADDGGNIATATP